VIAMLELKSIEQNLYNYIVKFKKEHDGNVPSYRQMADAINKESTSYISFLLDSLCKKGYIRYTFDSDKNRLIEVVEGRWFCIAEENGVNNG
jgi:SOS-response transcriptional repressor LexA